MVNGAGKIGAVSYLNTKPLVHGLAEQVGEDRVIYDLPSRLADRLAVGELEVGLIPVVEAALNPNCTVISDACIACHGPVRSVKIVSRVHPERIRTLALDTGSRTSALLARVLLASRHGVRPECRVLPIDEDWRSASDDAVLVIGDRAMHGLTDRDPGGFQFEWDLGETWRDWTGLPFVFAVWSAVPNADYNGWATLLAACRDRGCQALGRIAEAQASRYGMSPSDCLVYLRDQLHFFLGASERAGLSLFFRLAQEQSLLTDINPLKYHECGLAGQSR